METKILTLTDSAINLDISEPTNLFLDLTKEQINLNIQVKKYASLRLEIINKCNYPQVEVKGVINVEEGGECNLIAIDFSSSSVTMDLVSQLADDARYTASLAVVSSAKEKKNFNIEIDQSGKRSYSYVKMYGVAEGETELSLLGTTDVKRGAIKSFTCQEGTIVNLSDKGKTQVSPVLKISENDIKASHSAKLGKVSDDIMFYLMSRGLSRREASSLLTISYLKPVINEITVKKYQEELLEYIEKRDF